MKEYISKDYLDDILKHYLDNWWGPEYYACSVIQEEINCAPDSEIIRIGVDLSACGEELCGRT